MATNSISSSSQASAGVEPVQRAYQRPHPRTTNESIHTKTIHAKT